LSRLEKDRFFDKPLSKSALLVGIAALVASSDVVVLVVCVIDD
jgi:hypothetical protein